MITWTLIVLLNLNYRDASAFSVPGFSSKTTCIEGMKELKKAERALAEDAQFICLQVK